MSDERGRLYGACVRTHEVIWSSDQASRCWCAPRVYCLLSRLPCFSALFSVLLAAMQEERAERTDGSSEVGERRAEAGRARAAHEGESNLLERLNSLSRGQPGGR